MEALKLAHGDLAALVERTDATHQIGDLLIVKVMAIAVGVAVVLPANEVVAGFKLRGIVTLKRRGEFGAGFGFAAMHGSEANDPFTMRDGKIATATNKNGGINGGITNGMPIVFRTVLKPTPSIYKQQHTVDYISRTDAELQIKGRHDPCIVPRAAVVQNSLTAFGLLDLLTVRYGTLAQKHGFPKV